MTYSTHTAGTGAIRDRSVTHPWSPLPLEPGAQDQCRHCYKGKAAHPTEGRN